MVIDSISKFSGNIVSVNNIPWYKFDSNETKYKEYLDAIRDFKYNCAALNGPESVIWEMEYSQNF